MIAGRRRHRPVPLRLPPLDAAQALAVMNVLDGLIEAIWIRHGEQIAELTTDLSSATVTTRRPPRRALDHRPF